MSAILEKTLLFLRGTFQNQQLDFKVYQITFSTFSKGNTKMYPMDRGFLYR